MSKKRRLLWAILLLGLLLLIAERAATLRYQPMASSNDVIIYSTEWCPYCRALRIQFDALAIPYEERDIEKSLDAMAGFLWLGGRGVPLSVIGGQIIHGYRPAPISDALIAAGHPPLSAN
ncbi:MAG: glutaredoxin family protein [Gammaproteobacteria bacterium]|nr:glutaredoxin family protein [Gammaproteobacteria bacterium]